MSAAMFTVLIQAAATTVPVLITDILDIRDRWKAGEPISDKDWDALAQKWSGKSAEQHLTLAAMRAGLR